jgi:hypothetical protein
MSRSVTAGLLIICLGVFLCPAVGKPEIVTAPAKQTSCCAQTSKCAKMSENASPDKGCSSDQSQSSHCCPVPCSALILFCAAMEDLFAPAQTEHLVFARQAFAFVRTDRPPVPPPRV